MREKVIMRPDRCKACRRCEVACIAAHHGFDMKEAMKRRSEFGPRVRVIKGENYKTTVRCHECFPAPCVNICPTGALVQDENGIISMHPELCMACEMCMDACPYGAVHLDKVPFPAVDGVETPEGEEPATRTIAVRCDLCRDWRKANGKTMTACMEACPAQAIGILTTDGHTIFPEKNKPKPAPVKKVATKEDVSAAEITNR